MPAQLSKKFGIAVAALFTGLWAYPLYRAVSYLGWARDYYHETASINAGNDLNLAWSLVASYSVAVLAALALAYVIFRHPRFRLLLPMGLADLSVIEVLWLRPEVPIHLFPTMMPWRPALLNVMAVAIAVVVIYAPRFVRRTA